jgi:hypothetical protein
MPARKDPETITVRLGNGHQTSAGYGQPGDEVELPPDEASALVAAAYAVRTGTVEAARMHHPDAVGNYKRQRRGDAPGQGATDGVRTLRGH